MRKEKRRKNNCWQRLPRRRSGRLAVRKVTKPWFNMTWRKTICDSSMRDGLRYPSQQNEQCRVASVVPSTMWSVLGTIVTSMLLLLTRRVSTFFDPDSDGELLSQSTPWLHDKSKVYITVEAHQFVRAAAAKIFNLKIGWHRIDMDRQCQRLLVSFPEGLCFLSLSIEFQF